MVVDVLSFDVVDRYVRGYGNVLDPDGTSKWVPPMSSLVLSKEDVSALSFLTEGYYRVLNHIASEYDTFAEYLGFDEDLHALLSTLPSYRSTLPLGRLDVFRTPDGFRVIEANTESPGGAEECDTIERLFSEYFLDKVDGFPHRRLDGYLDILLSSYAEQAAEKGVVPIASPTIALLEWPEDVVANSARYGLFLDYAKERGFDVRLASPLDITYERGKGVVDGVPIDLFYRRFLLHDVPEKHADGYDFIRRLEDSSSVLVNPARSKCVGCKQALAIISGEAYESLFPYWLVEDVRDMRSYTPSTFSLLHPKLLEYYPEHFLSRRDEYVLKAGNGSSSKAVWVGADMSPGDWHDLLRQAWGNNYVLQERVELDTLPVKVFSDGVVDAQMHYLLSPYMLNGKYGGIYARATENNLLSSDREGLATILPVYEK
ncbi:hypothetical protein GF367_04320 [Candidatus Woesearchaeota archaeon]|nr:hypothetical protein [Candidatus Woesearchaeota archaeon]